MTAHARRTFTSLAALCALLATLSVTESRATAAPEAIRPGTKAFFAGLQLGCGIGVTSGFISQVRLRQEFGWHFQGQFKGPAIGVSLSESFGSGGFLFTAAPKFWWDIQIMDLGLYVAPWIHAGFGLATNGSSVAAFNWAFGAEARLVLFDTGYVSFQPIAFDFYHGDFGTSAVVRYNLMFGGGFTF